MKKNLAIASSVISVLCMTFSLASCGEKKTECEKNGHSFSDVWLNDSETHWHKCDNCDEKSEEAAHIFDNDADTTCNVCGYERPEHTHVATEWNFDETQHWKVCTVDGCGEQFDKDVHSMGEWTVKTPARDGYDEVDARYCSVCGREELKTIENTRLDFYMFVEDTSTVAGRGYIAKGTIQRGTVSVGDEIELSGFNGKSTVLTISKDGTSVESAKHGDSVDILVKPVTGLTVSKGQLLFRADTKESGTSFYTRITNKSEISYSNGVSEVFDFYVGEMFVSTVTVNFQEQINSGSTGSADLVFATKIPFVKFKFSLKTGDAEIFTGSIWKLN